MNYRTYITIENNSRQPLNVQRWLTDFIPQCFSKVFLFIGYAWRVQTMRFVH